MKRGVARGGVDDFELTICSFTFERWKVGWRGKWINNDIDVSGGGGECFRDGRPHAPSASGTDGDVGVSVVVGESEELTIGAVIDVKNVLQAG